MARRTRPNKERRALAAQARDVRRAQLRNLLDRLDRVGLTADERDALRGHVEPLLAEVGQLRHTVGGQQSAIHRHGVQLNAAHQAIEEAEQRAGQAEAALDRVRDALAPYDWPHAQVRAAAVRAALDEQQPTTDTIPEPQQ
jgi:chromosome segregation ATPase